MSAVRAEGNHYPGVCIVFFCHDGAGRFVMAKRSAFARDEQLRWDIGGGGLEFGLTIDDTLRSEIREEYCTTIREVEFLGYRDVHRVHDGRPTHWVALDFKIRIDPTGVRIGEPHKFDELGWFTQSTIPENLHSQLPLFFEKYREELFGV